MTPQPEGETSTAAVAADNDHPAAASKTDVSLGIVLEINDKIIPLRPKTALNRIKTDGIEVGLPAGLRVDLGPIGEDIDTIIQMFDSDWADGTLSNKLSSLPEPLDTIAEKVVNAHFSIEAFHLSIKPNTPGDSATLKTDESIKSFTLGMSLTWDPNASDAKAQPPELGGVKLRGIFLTLSNEGQGTNLNLE